jgi:hypothetical protein
VTAAVIASLLLVPFFVADATRAAVELGPLSTRQGERAAARRWGIRLEVIDEIGRIVPPTATYNVSFGRGVDPEEGQAFLAWTENVLLPRRRTGIVVEADWLIVWASAAAGGVILPPPSAGGPPLSVRRRTPK